MKISMTAMTQTGLSAFVAEERSVTAPTAPLAFHGTAVPVAARIRTAAGVGADLPGPPRGAPV